MTANVPVWLSDFVRNEVRPFLLLHRQAALEAWPRWLARHEECKRAQDAWENRKREFLRQLANVPEDQRCGPIPPSEGLVWLVGRVLLDKDKSMRVSGWAPPELSEYSGPAVEYPLPPPIDRDLSPDQTWAALLAIHDVARDRREWLGPIDSLPFVVLCDRVLELSEAHLPQLRAMLRTTSPALRGQDMDASPDCVASQVPEVQRAGGGQVQSAILSDEKPARHSSDFRSVIWFGTPFSFTANQAACIKVLWDAWENGTPDVGDQTIIEAADASSLRLSVVFRDSPAWGTMIRPGHTKGTHRLSEPN